MMLRSLILMLILMLILLVGNANADAGINSDAIAGIDAYADVGAR
jgi:hypothetical protein